MNDYEILLAISEDQAEDAQSKIIKEVTSTIEKGKGSVSQTDNWGKRALAFAVSKNTNASFWLLTFNADEETPKSLSNNLKINDKVLRYLITKKEAKKAVVRKKAKA